ncbi:hypothetical protein [Sharpea azabuensis]|uniref:hypothetical protein n=2 Tax=Sharpea azabuensis TaxID=322505 RepID=UPI0013DBF6C9|nr:hypothetical protein [Sharpea azabuensis]
MRYKIVEILEPDFGCEGRPDGYVQVDDVVVEDTLGTRHILKMEDTKLYELELDVGSYLEIEKVDDLNWFKSQGQNVDSPCQMSITLR